MKTLKDYLDDNMELGEDLDIESLEDDYNNYVADMIDNYREEMKDAFNGNLCGGY